VVVITDLMFTGFEVLD